MEIGSSSMETGTRSSSMEIGKNSMVMAVPVLTTLDTVFEHEVKNGLAGVRHCPVDVVHIAPGGVAQETYLDPLRHWYIQPCYR